MNFSLDYYSYYNIILWKRNAVVRHYRMCFLSFEFMDEDFDYIMVLKFEFSHAFSNPNIKQIIYSLESIYDNDQNTIVILTNKKDPPIFNESADEYVSSFGCSFHHFKNIISNVTRSEFLRKDMLFIVLDQISNGKSGLEKILIRQIPMQIEELSTNAYCDVIIPHRGENAFLGNLLFFLQQLPNLHIYNGIDQDLTDDILKLKQRFPASEFYNFVPNPVGPYVIRNYLIDVSINDLIFFQDSDDIPCADRFYKIGDYIKKTGCQLCGSHELRIDYFEKTVRAHRFPINAGCALEAGPWHPLLHPSSAITREAFYLCHKLSEERTFGNDTKFLLHSFFFLSSIHNVDEFLYIRRRHPNSLTTSPETMIDSPIRKKLLHTWNHDFERIKYGELSLENSSLQYEGTKLKFNVVKI